jgi:hypothetical protein
MNPHCHDQWKPKSGTSWLPLRSGSRKLRHVMLFTSLQGSHSEEMRTTALTIRRKSSADASG